MLFSVKKWTFVIFLVSGYLLGAFAQMGQSELKILSENADVIVTGKVIQQNSSWNENKTRIFTRATIQVEETLKGSGLNSVVVNYPGGEVGDIGEMYTHTPKFENDEEVLVFLEKDDKNTNYKVVNGEEGKINVLTDPKTGEKITASNVQINTLKAQIKSYIKD